MALIDMRDLLSHARAHGYLVPAYPVNDLDGLNAILDAAEHSRTPVVLVIAADTLRQQGRRARLLLTAMLAAARETELPVALYLNGHGDRETLVEAIRLGCNGVRLEPEATPDLDATLMMLRDCGVTIVFGSGEVDGMAGNPCVGHGERDRSPSRITQLIAGGIAMLDVPDEPGRDGRDDAGHPASLAAGHAAGRAEDVLAACRPWAPVEHVIVYNVEGADEQAVEAMMATGRRQLGAIPGVLDIFTGRALTADPKFRYCWLVRFTHPAVIRSYAAHPDHVAFADTRFRPIAGDRITIDYQAVETRTQDA